MFFTQIHQMMTEGVDLTLVMRKTQGQLTVSVMPKSNSLKDGAQIHLVPLTLSGTPTELDAGFIASAFQPMQRVTGLITNMAEFEKQAEKTAASSKSAKEKKEKEQKDPKDSKEVKEAKEKREKYDKYLKKAEEQIASKNYSDAIMAYQQAGLYATEEQKKKVDEKIAAAKLEQAQGSLFEMPAPQPAPVQAQPIQQPTSQASQPHMAPQMSNQPPLMQPQMVQPQAMHPLSAGSMPGQQYYQPAAAPQQMPPQYAQPASPYPAGGYQQEPQHYGPQYPPQYGQHYPLQPSEYPPTHRPEEYSEYVDFPQGMIAPAPVNPTTI